MQLLRDYIQHIEFIKTKINDWAKEAILQNQETILNILKDRQLSQGLGYSGDITLGKSNCYAKMTQDYWAKKSPIPRKPMIAGARYNMEWTGQFFDSLGINVKKNEYDIFSSTGKDTFLESIFGGGSLTKFREENNTWVNKNIIEPFIASKIQQELLKI